MATASLLPGRRVTTEEVAAATIPPMDPAVLLKKTGIHARHFTEPHALASDIGATVLRTALERSGLVPTDLRRIIFVSSSGGDRIVPATANLLAARLGLTGSCDAVDLNNSCMGFLTALDFAARCVATGFGPVGIAVVELLSRGTSPTDPRPFAIFGDAAAAAVIGVETGEGGIVAFDYANDGSLPEDVVFDHPLRTQKLERIRFEQPNANMARTVLRALQNTTASVLAKAQLQLEDVDWIVPHQPNGPMLDLVVQTLGIDPGRFVRVIDETGSVGAASLPTALHALMEQRDVRPGQLILFLGIGAGVARGAVLYKVGPS